MRGLEWGLGILLVGLGLVVFLRAPLPRRWGWGAMRAGLSFLLMSAGYSLILYPYFIRPASPLPPPASPAIPPAPTASPTLSFTPSPSPSPPTPEPSPSPSPPPASPSPPSLACPPEVLRLIEQANAAQEAYIRGQGTLEQLAAAWGEAAPEAQRQGDRLRQAAQALQATLQEVRWEIHACSPLSPPGPDFLEVRTEETWTYRASRVCPPGQRVTVDRVVTYPAEIYRVAVSEGRWRILRWSPGEGTIRQDWRCP